LNEACGVATSDSAQASAKRGSLTSPVAALAATASTPGNASKGGRNPPLALVATTT
jgi:hypothetical protein